MFFCNRIRAGEFGIPSDQKNLPSETPNRSGTNIYVFSRRDHWSSGASRRSPALLQSGFYGKIQAEITKIVKDEQILILFGISEDYGFV